MVNNFYIDALSADVSSISLPAFVGPVLFVGGKVCPLCATCQGITYTCTT